MISVAGQKVALLHDGAACLEAMQTAIAGAQREILLEMYWFGSDRTGRKFARLLSMRARAGLRVCITYDAFGSWDSSAAMFADLARAGCLLHRYNPPGVWTRLHCARLQRRNHRKMLIIDGQVGFVGGLNLGDPWAPESQGGQGFRDDMVQITGPAVGRLRFLFFRTFRPRLAQAPAICPEAGPAKHRRDGSGIAEQAPPGHFVGADGAMLSILSNRTLRQRSVIENAYLTAIQGAQRSVLISNSYFIPRRPMRRALAEAARRGVDVRILTPARSDVPPAAFASQRLYTWLLAHGVGIYEWPVSVLHSKIATVDDQWCTVGTYNLDYRSYFYNIEINIVFQAAAVASALAARLRADLAASHRIDADSWRYRPMTNRFLEHLFYWFRHVL